MSEFEISGGVQPKMRYRQVGFPAEVDDAILELSRTSGTSYPEVVRQMVKFALEKRGDDE